MTVKSFLDHKVVLHAGDCLEALAILPEASVDSVVCDPPYHLTNNTGTRSPYPGQYTPIGQPEAPKGGFMGKLWDGGNVAFRVETWAAVLRVLKPGGHLVAFSGTRTYHRMACAIEDAGFEIRDQLAWCYGSGFPKSHDVAKAIDRHLGVKREVLGVDEARLARLPQHDRYQDTPNGWQSRGRDVTITEPATAEASQWEGWGTALKPAWEPIVLARKPLIGTVAENVLRHGTGAINVDGCRIVADAGDEPLRWEHGRSMGYHGAENRGQCAALSSPGRWPANICHDGSDEVLAAFPDSLGAQGDVKGTEPSHTGDENTVAYGKYGRVPSKARRDGEASANRRYADNGATNFAALPGMRRDAATSAARFFYTAKADAEDRLGSKHPTVKPLDLMQWLCRLVTPPQGTILDPFAGTGTTGEAAWREGMNAILIEREAEYQADITRRMELATNPTKRAAVAKTKNNLDRPEDLPLFAVRE